MAFSAKSVFTGAMVLTLSAVAAPALAEQPATTLTTLLDKQQIQDVLVNYYGQLGSGRSDFGAYYVDDGVIDVNGTVAKGQKAIEEVYAKAAAATPPKPGAYHMLVSNVSVVVNGNTATADCIWTEVLSSTVYATPQLVEQGREHDELVKVNGRWLFKHRVISSDGGLDPKSFFAKTYKKR